MTRSIRAASRIALAAVLALLGSMTPSCTGAEPDLSPAPVDAGGDGAEQVPPGCDPSKEPKDEPCLVTESVGIFVTPTGDDATIGTKLEPMRTIARGIERAKLAGKQRVFVCEGTYPEKLVLGPESEGVRIFGGFACADFSYSGARPRIAPNDPGVVLRVDRLPRATSLSDLELIAKDAVDPGASSITATISGSESVVFRRVSLIAGKGAKGSDAAAPATNHAGDPRFGFHWNGARANRECNCADGSKSFGGHRSGPTNAEFAGPGASMPPTTPTRANQGTHDALGCTWGSYGADGAGGIGAEARATKVSFVDGAIVPAAVADGKPGLPAQGGGGGGGKLAAGQSGSGGGCGGCGGAGGLAGKSGGSSVAVVVLNTAVLFFQSSLSVADAGAGGAASAGEIGQVGAGPGNPEGTACYGGNGGHGGGGGGGGGGPGGHAIALLFAGNAPTWDEASMADAVALAGVTLGAPGAGGAGGAGGASAVSNSAPGMSGADGPIGIARAASRLE